MRPFDEEEEPFMYKSFNLILGFSLNETHDEDNQGRHIAFCFNLILGFSLNETEEQIIM